jgi:hypothetical protein
MKPLRPVAEAVNRDHERDAFTGLCAAGILMNRVDVRRADINACGR